MIFGRIAVFRSSYLHRTHFLFVMHRRRVGFRKSSLCMVVYPAFLRKQCIVREFVPRSVLAKSWISAMDLDLPPKSIVIIRTWFQDVYQLKDVPVTRDLTQPERISIQTKDSDFSFFPSTAAINHSSSAVGRSHILVFSVYVR